MALEGRLELQQIKESLKRQGINEQKLQRLENTGALQQLTKAGANERSLQKR